MNVAFDQWIPVVTTTGERKLASLCTVLTEGDKFVDLAVRPHERVALMRLFICVAHAALYGPKDYIEWCETPKRLPDAAQQYLKKWKESFELFHSVKPWLQVAELSKVKGVNKSQSHIEDWARVSKLNFSFATGSNSTIFDHDAMNEERIIGLTETLLSMLTFQCFSVGGLIGQIYWNGIRCGELANPKKENGPVKSSDGPCVPASMIHAFLRGKNLKETICLNMTTHNEIHSSYGKGAIGRPVWEMIPKSLDNSAEVENATKTYVGRLVPMTRLIRLHNSGERMLLGDGLIYPSYINGFPAEPTATIIIKQKDKKEERAVLSYRPDKAFWRELAAVVVKRKAEGSGGPLSLRNIQDGENCDLIVAALARDKATIVDTAESVFHIPSQLLSYNGMASYESEVKKAESLAGRLGWAVETYRREMDHGWEGKLKAAGPSKGKLKAKLYSIATTHYWTTVENNLQLLLTHIKAIGKDDAIPTREGWRKMLFVSACDAYRIACGQETPRQMRAFAKGLQKLTGEKDNHEPNNNKHDKEEKHELAS